MIYSSGISSVLLQKLPDGSLLVCGVTIVGQLQVPKTLTFKMRPRATPSSVHEFCLHDRPGGTWEWSIQCLRLLI